MNDANPLGWLVTGGALLAVSDSDPAAAVRPVAPKTVGPYRLLREIASGGSATVYQAVRCDGRFEQNVAIKLVYARGGWKERFLLEWRALGALEHPSIVRIFDAGVCGDFLWLSMEYVEGQRLDDHFAEGGCHWTRRLELLGSIAGALAHAHERQVVHGDIKPCNILVASDGTAKLVDFGVARRLNDADASRSGFTMAYASPEQRRGEPITTRTDTFQLALLVERLVGSSKPLPKTVAAALQAIIARGKTEQDAVRYVSALELQRDLFALARNRPPAWSGIPGWARVGLLIRRQGSYRLAGLALLVLAAAIAAFELNARDRDRQRLASLEAAREVETEFMANLMRTGAQLDLPPQSNTLVAMLEVGGKRVLEMYRDKPLEQGLIVATLAENLLRLERWEQAKTLLREVDHGKLDTQAPELAYRLYHLQAVAISHSDGPEPAKRVLDAADELSLAAQLPLHTADSMRLLLAKVQVASGAGDRAAARGYLAAALRTAEIGHLDNTRAFADVLEEAAQFHQREAEYDVAFAYQSRAIALLGGLFGEGSPAAANARRGLLYIRMGRGDPAAQMRPALAAEKQVLIALFGPNSSELIDIYVLEQYVAVNEGEYGLAIQVAEDALDNSRQNYPEVSMQVASMRHNLGEALLAAGEYARGARELQRTVELRRQLVDPNHQSLLLLRPMLEVANCHLDVPTASTHFEQSMATYAQLYPQRSFQHAWLAAEFALCALQKGRRVQARQVMERYPLLAQDLARGGDRLRKIERARHALGLSAP